MIGVIILPSFDTSKVNNRTKKKNNNKNTEWFFSMLINMIFFENEDVHVENFSIEC